MQIHEITRRRRTNEGILSKAGAIGGGIVNALAGSVLNKAQQATGIEIKADNKSIAPGQAQTAGSEASKMLVAPMTKNAIQRWEQAIASWAKQVGSINPSAPGWQQLEGNMDETLTDMINRQLLRNQIYGGYNNLPALYKNSPEMTLPASNIAKRIDTAKNNIVKAGANTQQLEKNMSDLVMGVVDAQNMIQTQAPQNSRDLTGQGAQLATQLGLDQNQAEDLAAAIAAVPLAKQQALMANINSMMQAKKARGAAE